MPWVELQLGLDRGQCMLRRLASTGWHAGSLHMRRSSRYILVMLAMAEGQIWVAGKVGCDDMQWRDSAVSMLQGLCGALYHAGEDSAHQLNHGTH